MRMAPRTLGFIAPPTSIATILRTRSGLFASNLKQYMLWVRWDERAGVRKYSARSVARKRALKGTHASLLVGFVPLRGFSAQRCFQSKYGFRRMRNDVEAEK